MLRRSTQNAEEPIVRNFSNSDSYLTVLCEANQSKIPNLLSLIYAALLFAIWVGYLPVQQAVKDAVVKADEANTDVC